MPRAPSDWEALIEHLDSSEAELAPLRDQAKQHLDQAHEYYLAECNGARLRWSYAGLPALWMQCEAIRTQEGKTSSRIFSLSLENLEGSPWNNT